MKKIIFLLIFLLYPFLISAQEYKIKPGVILTKENYEKYLPELKGLLIPGYLIDVTNALKNGWITLPIVEKKEYPPVKTFLKATLNNAGKLKVDSKNRVIGNWKAGLPFPVPKTGAELAWNVYRRHEHTDNMSFYADFLLFNKKNTVEREFKWHLYMRHWVGRTFIPPIPEEPGNNGIINLKESLAIVEPFDVKGFSQIRIRYEDIFKDDDVFSYIPTIRRIRRLTGSDLTDPILGSDATPDDFEGWRQKINPKMTFKMKEKEVLVPCQYYEKPKAFVGKGNCFQANWEIKPFYVLYVYTNDPGYAYSRREVLVDKEGRIASVLGGENYDQIGRLWRAYHNIAARDPETGDGNAGYVFYFMNYISSHSTYMNSFPIYADPKATKEVFTFKRLLREAR